MRRHLSLYLSALHKDFMEYCNTGLSKLKLTQGLLFFILYIGRHPGCSPSNIYADLGFDTGHTTRSLEKLIASGFVLKKKSEEDKRSCILELTPSGEDAFAYSRDLVSEWEKKTLSSLSEEEVSQLLYLLNKIESKEGFCYDKRK